MSHTRANKAAVARATPGSKRAPLLRRRWMYLLRLPRAASTFSSLHHGAAAAERLDRRGCPGWPGAPCGRRSRACEMASNALTASAGDHPAHRGQRTRSCRETQSHLRAATATPKGRPCLFVFLFLRPRRDIFCRLVRNCTLKRPTTEACATVAQEPFRRKSPFTTRLAKNGVLDAAEVPGNKVALFDAPSWHGISLGRPGPGELVPPAPATWAATGAQSKPPMAPLLVGWPWRLTKRTNCPGN